MALPAGHHQLSGFIGLLSGLLRIHCPLCVGFRTLHLRPNTKASTAKVTERLIRVYFHHLEHKRLSAISARDIITTLHRMKDTPQAANSALVAIKHLFNWAASQQLIEDTPLRHVQQPYLKTPRTRLLTDEEITLIWNESYNHNSFGQVMRSPHSLGTTSITIHSHPTAVVTSEHHRIPGTDHEKQYRAHHSPLTSSAQPYPATR